MNIVIPVRQADAEHLKSLTGEILKNGSIHGHSITIIHSRKVTPVAEECSAKLKTVTNDVKLLPMEVEPMGGQQLVMNKYFQFFLRKAGERENHPSLWMPTWSVPSGEGWATAIQDEYTNSFKQFLGAGARLTNGESYIDSPIVLTAAGVMKLIPTWNYLGDRPWQIQWRHKIMKYGMAGASISRTPGPKVRLHCSPTGLVQPVSMIATKVAPRETVTKVATKAPEDMRLTEFNDMVRSSHSKLRLSEVADRMNIPRDQVRELAERSNIQVNKGGWLALA